MLTNSLRERVEDSPSRAYIRGYHKGQKDLAERLKAELIAKHFSIVEQNDFDNGRTYSYDECLSILENIVRETKNEDKGLEKRNRE